ncbi:hypothetical protein BC830DRAFT_1156429 [Chytriomyces sp. MP71]|nr:hypothetical protein BC830DRAFT_1156429 [Chytriomyces sp. MP71]
MTNLSDHFLSFVETSDANTKLYAPEHPLRASISVARTPRQPNPLRDSSTTDELIELLRNKKPLHISAQSSLTRKPLFSADRYYAKHGREDADAESWEEAGAETAKEATDVFRIESVAFASLVAQSSDDVATEARALLRQWIDAAPVSRRVRCNEARTSDDSESAEMRRVLHSAVGIEAPPKVVSTLLPRPKPPTLQEPRVSAALRQSLAKQRRELAELKRRTELGRRLDEGRDASQKHSFVHEWEAEMSRKLFKKASVEGVEDARRKAHEERERLVEAQREKQTIEELARYEQEQHRRKREDCERKRTYARAKVEELYLLKTLKVLSPLFSAWRDHTAKQNMNLQSLLVRRSL